MTSVPEFLAGETLPAGKLQALTDLLASTFGLIAEATDSASRTIGTSAADVPNLALTYDQISGRRYRYFVQARLEVENPGAAAGVRLFVTTNADSALGGSGEGLRVQGGTDSVARVFGLTGLYVIDEIAAATGPITRKVRSQRSGGTAGAARGDLAVSRFWVEAVPTFL